MITKMLQGAAFIVAASLAGVPAISQAATTQAAAPVHATYETSMQSIYGLDAPWTGTLQLTIGSDGIIQGFYHPADNMTALIPVTGGRDGNSVWLDIGRSGRLHVNGVLENGVITGGAVDESTHTPYKFSARISG
ncbi:MAG TPA: hypothetical protein VJP85_06600 [Candidatus Baltobacteraceae bacterium]|nr:hypothetical protein [Candidatus Baltobacteraceae bacterium]